MPAASAATCRRRSCLTLPACLAAPSPQVKEVSYMHSEGINAGEMKHGPLALVDDKLPIVVISTMDTMHSKMAGVIQQVGGAAGWWGCRAAGRQRRRAAAAGPPSMLPGSAAACAAGWLAWAAAWRVLRAWLPPGPNNLPPSPAPSRRSSWRATGA